MATAGRFAASQPVYAALGIPIFPVKIADKKPAVANYQRIGLRASADLARRCRFHDAPAFGFTLGKRNGITVLDCDSTDENIFAAALARHGETPFKVRSGSGHFQAWYRHGGERRHIRPNPALPVDILGGGYVVAPPSQGRAAPYTIISGSLDDLDRLPTLQNFLAPKAKVAAGVAAGEISPAGRRVPHGVRNRALWEHCMRHAPHCDDLAQLLDVARTFAENECEQPAAFPITDAEITASAASAWRITEAGKNRFVNHAVVVSLAEADRFMSSMTQLGFLTWLKAHNGSDSDFMVADGLAPTVGLSRDLLRSCRRQLIDAGVIHMVSAPRRGVAAFYRWGNGLSKSAGLDCSTTSLRQGGDVSKDRGRNPVGHCKRKKAAPDRLSRGLQ
jgi:Bifunctional DNA primase/polymerase, N-terminal